MADRRFTTPRRVRLEAGAWGALVALNAAFVSLLLISRGADALALAVYASGASLFGLAAGVLGPWIAARVGNATHVVLAAVGIGRTALTAVPLLLLTGDEAVLLLIAALLLWSAGEGVAQPLWIAFLARASDSAERHGWVSARATAAAVGAACAMAPMVVLAQLLPIERSLLAAYLVALAAGLVSTWQVVALCRLRTLAATPQHRMAPETPHGPGLWFLGGVFAFWFGAALNRPVLPPYVVNELQAPAAYFATAAVVAAVAGAGLQPRWGTLGSARGVRALLGWSGLVAGIAPLLWSIVPDYRFGIPVEAMASGCWLGHLLGLNLYAVEAAHDEAHRALVIARMQLAQGSAAAIAPLAAATVVGEVGTVPILMASGVVCLAATAVMTDVVRAPSIQSLDVRGMKPAIMRRLRGWRPAPETRHESHGSTAGPVAGVSLLRWAVERQGGQVRQRLPIPLLQVLSADCPSCRGIGCGACYGSGLG